MDIIPDLPGNLPIKGRGAISNPTGRYERETRQRTDDGWTRPQTEPGPQTERRPNHEPQTQTKDGTQNLAEHLDENPCSEKPRNPDTRFLVDASRSVITRNTSPDVPFDRSINPYRGCEHGCIYCFARPTHAWLGLSPGMDFETRIFTKPDAPKRLAHELGRKSYKCAPIALGTNTDPYQPIERRLRITRGILQVLSDHNHPVTIVTKSDGVLKDIDLLADMAARNLVQVHLSITSLDGGLTRNLEPRTPTAAKRLNAIKELADANIPVGVMAAPMIPALNDHELEAILEAAHDVGAITAGYILLRLPLEVKDLFAQWLRAHYPDREAKVLNLVRETRAGKLNDSDFKQRMRGKGVYA
ncbi:MAG: PA0069 family radical SAM protein [Alphaproteobacteria bacterium]